MTHEPIRKALMAVLVLPGFDDATRDVKELAAAALADLDRVTRERDEVKLALQRVVAQIDAGETADYRALQELQWVRNARALGDVGV